MTKFINTLNIFGKWNIDVNTPFGKENYTLNVDTIGLIKNHIGYDCFIGSIDHKKGSVSFTDAKFENNTFYCSVETEFPIKTTVSITANLIEDNKISGMLEIDQYLITSFIGVK